MEFSARRPARRWRNFNPRRASNRRARWMSQRWKRSEWRNKTLGQKRKSPRGNPRRFFCPRTGVRGRFLRDVDLGGVIVRAATAIGRPRFVSILQDGPAPDRSVAGDLDRRGG